MSDQSPSILEERNVTSTWIRERHNTGDTLDSKSAKYKERFRKNPPTHKTMSKWESKLFETGNAKDASRLGRTSETSRTMRELGTINS